MINPQAIELNDRIKASNEAVYNLLSSKGRAIFFPKKGILGQTADAKTCNINATIGAAFEDDGTIMYLKSLDDKIDHLSQEIFSYAPSFGTPAIRKRWQQMLYDKNSGLKEKRISLPVVTSALTHGLSMTSYLFFNDSESIIIPDMFWGNYNLCFKNGYGANFDTFSTFTKNNGFNTKGLKNKLANGSIGKKCVILNFPNNPTGYTPTIEETEEIVAILKESAENGNKILVIIDDAYFGLVYEDGILLESIFAQLADAHENLLAVKIDGPTKEDYVWGFRVGFVTFGIKNGTNDLYNALESKLAGAIRGNISNSSHLAQSLLLSAYNDKNYMTEKHAKYNTLKKRYIKIKSLLAEKNEWNDAFDVLPFNSGYFMCIRIKKVTDCEELRKLLIKKYSTGIIVLHDIFRIAFSAVPYNKIDQLFTNIYQAIVEIRSCQV